VAEGVDRLLAADENGAAGLGGDARIANVQFGDDYEARHSAAGAYVSVDTRIDPSFPRNAIHTRIGWEHLAFDNGGNGVGRFFTDARGYLGIGGSAVLALRGQIARADSPLPASGGTIAARRKRLAARLSGRSPLRRQPGRGVRRSARTVHIPTQHQPIRCEGIHRCGYGLVVG